MSFIDEKKALLKELQLAHARKFYELQAIENKKEWLEHQVYDFEEILDRINNLDTKNEVEAVSSSKPFYTLTGDIASLKPGEFKRELMLTFYEKLQGNEEAQCFVAYKFQSEIIPILQKSKYVPVKVWAEAVRYKENLFDHIPEKLRQDFEFLKGLLSHCYFLYYHFPLEAKRNPEVCLAYLKACGQDEVELVQTDPENLRELTPLLQDRDFVRQAVVHWPFVSYLMPPAMMEDAEFAYELFELNHDSAKALYLTRERSDEILDHEKARTELNAKAELQRLNRNTPQTSATTPKEKFKL